MELPTFGIPARILAGKDERFKDVVIYYRARMIQALMTRIYNSMETRSNARRSDPVAGKWAKLNRMTTKRKGHAKIGYETGEMFAALSPGTATASGYDPPDPRQKVLLNSKEFRIDVSAVPQAKAFADGINSWGHPQPKRPLFPPSTREAWWPWFYDSHLEVMPDVKAFYITKLTEYRSTKQSTDQLTKSQSQVIIALRSTYTSWQELSFSVVAKDSATITFLKQKDGQRLVHQYKITPRGKVTRTFGN
jgi:hypothetical protein